MKDRFDRIQVRIDKVKVESEIIQRHGIRNIESKVPIVSTELIGKRQYLKNFPVLVRGNSYDIQNKQK